MVKIRDNIGVNFIKKKFKKKWHVASATCLRAWAAMVVPGPAQGPGAARLGEQEPCAGGGVGRVRGVGRTRGPRTGPHVGPVAWVGGGAAAAA